MSETLKVRKMGPVDRARLRAFASVFHKTGCFSHVDIPTAHINELTDEYLDRMAADPNVVLLTHDKGALGAAIERAEMGLGTVLRERFFMAERGSGGVLLDAFHSVARTRGVDLTALSLICKDGRVPPALHNHYVDMGYEMVEAVYVRKVDKCP